MDCLSWMVTGKIEGQQCGWDVRKSWGRDDNNHRRRPCSCRVPYLLPCDTADSTVAVPGERRLGVDLAYVRTKREKKKFLHVERRAACACGGTCRVCMQ